ncbi:MAG: dockerin type I domain-containing protein [Candidatus Peregrinibacteria bacterium]
MKNRMNKGTGRRGSKVSASKSSRRRYLAGGFERVEPRVLLSANPVNPKIWADVNGDGKVTPLDVLESIVDLNQRGPRIANAAADGGKWYDVTLDRRVTPQDPLAIIAYLDEYGSGDWNPQYSGEMNVHVNSAIADIVAVPGQRVELMSGELYPVGGSGAFTGMSMYDIVPPNPFGSGSSIVSPDIIVDTDGDLKVDTVYPCSMSGDFVQFASSFNISEGQTVPFEVWATVAQDARPGTEIHYTVAGVSSTDVDGSPIVTNVIGKNHTTIHVQDLGAQLSGEVGKVVAPGDHSIVWANLTYAGIPEGQYVQVHQEITFRGQDLAGGHYFGLSDDLLHVSIRDEDLGVIFRGQLESVGAETVTYIFDIYNASSDVNYSIRTSLDETALTDSFIRTELPSNGILVGPWVEVQNPGLAIMQLRGATDPQYAVSNERQIEVMSFEARALVKPELLRTVIISAESGNLRNLTNGTLSADLNGDHIPDTTLQTGVPVQSGKMTFGQITGGALFVGLDSVILFVTADVASSLQTDASVKVGFATGSVFLEAERYDTGASLVGLSVNGSDPNAQIRVQTANGTSFEFVNHGSIGANQDLDNTYPDRYVMAGELSDPVVTVDLTAKVETGGVDYVGIDVVGEKRSIVSFELWVTGATTATAVSSGADVQSGDDFGIRLVPGQLVADGIVTFSLRARIDSGFANGHSGDSFVAVVDRIEAHGIVSSKTYPVLDTDIRSATQTVVTAGIQSETSTGQPAAMLFSGIGVPVGGFVFTASQNPNAAIAALLDIPIIVSAADVEVGVQGWFLLTENGNRVDASSVTRADGTPFVGNTFHGSGLVNFDVSSVWNFWLQSGYQVAFTVFSTVVNANTSTTGESSILQLGQPTADVVWKTVDFGQDHLFTGLKALDPMIESWSNRG